MENVQLPLSYEWTELSEGLLAAVSSQYYLRTSLDSENLALDAGLLQAGSQYAFSLTVRDSLGSTGQSIHFVDVNSRPVITSFTADLLHTETGLPTNKADGGFELLSTYRLLTNAHHEGSAEGLSYEFSYEFTDSAIENAFPLSAAQVSPFVDVRLPAGDLRVLVSVTAPGYVH